MGDIKKIGQLDKNIYAEAASQNLSLTQWLEQQVEDDKIDGELIPPTAEERVKLGFVKSGGHAADAFTILCMKQGLRLVSTPTMPASKGRDFTASSENKLLIPEFFNRVISAPVSAYDNLNPYAAAGDQFMTSENDILFPGTINRNIQDYTTDALNEVQLGDLVSIRITTEGITYEGVNINDTQRGKLGMGRVTEGSELPRVRIETAQHAMKLGKWGHVVEVTYELFNAIAVDFFGLILRQRTADERRRKTNQAMLVMLNGDGNGNPALNFPNPTNAQWQKSHLRGLMLDALDLGKGIRFIAMDRTEMETVLGLADNVDKTARESGFNDSGTLPTFYGMIPRLAPSGGALDGTRKIMAIPSDAKLAEVTQSGTVIQETDKLITSQWEQFTWSEYSDYMKLLPTAAITRERIL